MTRKLFKRALFALVFVLFSITPLAASQTDIAGPRASSFGTSVTVLPNGNIVVTAPDYDIRLDAENAGAASLYNSAENVGAVYLYNGATLALISQLFGTTANDNVGSGGITVLTNGNYVVSSPNWDDPSPAAVNAGAVTWCSQTTGCSGRISASNSLVGGTANDFVGNFGVTALMNGNYVVSSRFWDDPSPAAVNAGAVTWGDGASGTSGVVTAANSLVGGTANDNVGSDGITVLTNGNYVVSSLNWDNPSPAAVNAGAITWGDGASGTSGVVTAANSLVGGTANDFVGNFGVTVLTNGNYVVSSPFWNNPSPAAVSAGAVTWGDGASGTSGLITAANSLVGGTANDNVGNFGVTTLTSGNYVVSSPFWDDPSPAAVNAGAATWGDGASGTSGLITTANSLVGGRANNFVGSNRVAALTNGNYVVSSPDWDNPSPAAVNAGAATWGNGAGGTSGVVTAANSIVGGTDSDFVGSSGVTALTNGNYVVNSANWDDPSPVVNAGAVTWGDGAGGTSGLITTANSLVGGRANNFVGSNGVAALTNGNYVVSSANWDNPSPVVIDAGAVTWGNGASGTSGVVTAANSLVGGRANDNVGSGVTALTNGNYVVSSANWDNPSPVVIDAGAVTWGNGAGGTSGLITTANSLVGGRANDIVGSDGITALMNGNYVVSSANWDNPSPVVIDAGAVTWGNGASGTSGVVTAANSLVGGRANDIVGSDGITALMNGNYVVSSANWDNPSPVVIDATAVTFGNGAGGTSGLLTSANSVVGTKANVTNSFAFDGTRNRLFVGRGASNIVSVIFFNTTVVNSGGDINNPATFNNGLPNGLVNAIVPNGFTLNLNTVTNIGQVAVECGGALSGAGYIIGSIRKDYCAAAGETFLYPLGDADDYSPLRTTNVTGTGFLTASVTDTTLPGLPPPLSVSRYWSLTGGGITTDLSFTYVDADVNGAEIAYKVYRRLSMTELTPSSNDAATNTATATGISSFSDWGIGSLFTPTAASVTVGGRVILPNDSFGLTRTQVTLTDAAGNARTTLPNKFGNFIFREVAAGETYIISVTARGYTFAPQIVTVNEDLTDLIFTSVQ